MKYKAIEKIAPVQPGKKSGQWVNSHIIGNTFVIDFWDMDKPELLRHRGRYAMNADTGEYASQTHEFPHHCQTWTNRGILWFYRENPKENGYFSYFSYEEQAKMMRFSSKKDEEAIKALIGFEEKKKTAYYEVSVYNIITRMETQYNANRRDVTSKNHMKAVHGMMDRIPPRPDGLELWIDQMAAGGREYLIKTPEGKYNCTSCGNQFTESRIMRSNKKTLPKDRQECKCPGCKQTVIMSKRSVVDIRARFYLMQDIDEHMSVSRHFQAHINYSKTEKKHIWLSEAIRFVMFRDVAGKRGTFEIYYNQIPAYEYGHFYTGDSSWDTKKSWGNRYMDTGYIYPDGITEALAGTDYEHWIRTFTAAAARGLMADYNQLMASRTPEMHDICEMLIKGRFYRMFKETADCISVWSGSYTGPLETYGDCIEDVFGLADRQLINRLRELNGGRQILEWLQLSDEKGVKLSAAFLAWASKNNIRISESIDALARLSPEAMMNYIIRQKREQYPGKKDSTVLSQYTDYLSMAAKEGKDLTDAMVYKPRELKRRHDELVAEINKRKMIEQMKRDKDAMKKKAKEYRERFPGAEENLKAISSKFTWQDEEYSFIVPKSLLEIVTEGQALHHCVGATDRYFDRIVQRETFIVFLRKVSEPKVPYYTIEVEPGGTVRQHRGAYDEEPDIERIKPHIRKWQAHIRKEMNRKDHADAKISKQKREANIAQLKKDNNTRVLSGLLEDFMEAL